MKKLKSAYQKLLPICWLLAWPLVGQAQDEVIAKGAKVFQDNCTVCHKLGEQVIGPDLTGIHERRAPDWIQLFVKNSAKMIATGDKEAIAIYEKFNKTQMTAFEATLAQADIEAVVTYLKTAKAVALVPPLPVSGLLTDQSTAVVPAKNWFAAMPDGDRLIFAMVIGLVALLGGLLLTVAFQLMGYLRDLSPRPAALGVPAKPQIFRLGSRGFLADIRGLFSGVVTNEYIEGHTYDGIQELDNGMPSWLAYFFYVTVAFGVVYWLNYHVFKFSELPDAEYQTEMAQAATMFGNPTDQVRVAILPVMGQDQIDKGKATYTANCVACHGKLGEGGVGPNLTDEYWLHGGKFEDLFHIVREGVAAKGMIAWKGKLSDQSILEVSTYIQTLVGTKPANGKPPQGEKVN